MRGTIIAVVSQKGGAGKTTVTLQLAAGLVERGRRVALVDLDPQQSALRWSELAVREGRSGIPLATAVGASQDEAAALKAIREAGAGVDHVLVDCPPALEHPHVAAALQSADLVLVPVVPGPTDIWSTRAVEQLILRARPGHKVPRAMLLPNRVGRTRLAAEALELLHEFRLPMLAAVLSQRSAYVESAIAGGSVFELGRQAEDAQREVRVLVRAVIRELEMKR